MCPHLECSRRRWRQRRGAGGGGSETDCHDEDNSSEMGFREYVFGVGAEELDIVVFDSDMFVF